MSGCSASTRRFDLSGVTVRLSGLPDDLRSELDSRWSAYAAESAGVVQLDVAVTTRRRPAAWGRPSGAELVGEGSDARRATFRMPEGEATVGADGRAELSVAEGSAHERFYVLVNLLLAIVGWSLPARGGLVLHGAAVVLDERGFLMLGSSGAGKSTWAELARGAGATLVSDDVIVVDAAGTEVELLSTPFRAHLERPAGPGRWPVAALLAPAHGASARLDPLDRMHARALLTASAMYLTPQQRRSAGVTSALERIVGAVPLRTLTFAPEPSFVPLLRKLGSDGER